MRFVLKRHDKVLFVFFVAALISSFLFWTFEERFNEKAWHASPTTRYKMADDLIDKELLIGKSKDNVIEFLGTSFITNFKGQDNFAYRMGRSPSFSEPKQELLIVIFKNGRVSKVTRSEE